MGQPPELDLSTLLEELRGDTDAPFKLPEIRGVLEEILSTLDGDLSRYDVKMYAEIEGLAQLIQTTKEELAALRPDEISDEHIAVATDELDAVVAATEEATNSIMEAAEEIETIAGGLDEADSSKLMDASSRIFVACSFQDITGQRITKVVTALKHIDAKIDMLIKAFGDNEEMRKRAQERKAAEAPPPDTDDDSSLLHGPQLPENAQNQDDIDALLASLD